MKKIFAKASDGLPGPGWYRFASDKPNYWRSSGGWTLAGGAVQFKAVKGPGPSTPAQRERVATVAAADRQDASRAASALSSYEKTKRRLQVLQAERSKAQEAAKTNEPLTGLALRAACGDNLAKFALSVKFAK